MATVYNGVPCAIEAAHNVSKIYRLRTIHCDGLASLFVNNLIVNMSMLCSVSTDPNEFSILQLHAPGNYPSHSWSGCFTNSHAFIQSRPNI